MEGGEEMSKDYRQPDNILKVIIRNDAPMVFCNDTPSYRSVDIELTEDQMDKIKLRHVGTSGKTKYYEDISRCFLNNAEYQ